MGVPGVKGHQVVNFSQKSVLDIAVSVHMNVFEQVVDGDLSGVCRCEVYRLDISKEDLLILFCATLPIDVASLAQQNRKEVSANISF